MLWQERIESLKTGVVGAIACTLAAIAFTALELSCWPHLRPQPELGALPWASLGWAIAAATGFLFAITYRYVIRQDPSPHLRSGAVLAFGLVRGLAQVEMGEAFQGEALLLLLSLGESLGLVAIARVILDRGLAQGWIKPFQGFEASRASWPKR